MKGSHNQEVRVFSSILMESSHFYLSDILMSYIICYYVGIYAPLSPSLTTRLNGELLQHVKDERNSDEEKALRRQEMF
jgi:hypothetical protein